MRYFRDKTVVITGAATGIGLALAKQFVLRGAKVVLAARRLSRLEQAAQQFIDHADKVRIFECDVTDGSQVEKLADFAEKEFGKVDVLVNNAGVGPIASKVIDAKREDVQSILNVNLFGVWNGVSVFGSRFIRQGTECAIYNVGSENCFFNAVPEGAGYVASKHALLAMTVALREEVPDSISVSLICPGLVKSELSKETSEGMDTDEYASLVMEQLLAEKFFIVSHSYNTVRINALQAEIADAYAKYAPRHEGDDKFDVRTLGAKYNWHPDMLRL